MNKNGLMIEYYLDTDIPMGLELINGKFIPKIPKEEEMIKLIELPIPAYIESSARSGGYNELFGVVDVLSGKGSAQKFSYVVTYYGKRNPRDKTKGIGSLGVYTYESGKSPL